MKAFFIFTILSIPVIWSSAVFSQTALTINTALGGLQGQVTDNGTTIFRGVPYAVPPIGDLRFRAPQALTSFNGTLNATDYGKSCPSITIMTLPQETQDQFYSEDCLFLNVFVPSTVNLTNDDNTTYPVRVWFHGGSFASGSSVDYPAEVLAEKSGSIIVTFNYRLGIFGFLTTTGLLNEDSTAINVGLLDQRLALQWVFENIGAFRGDSNNIMLFGQDSGAMSVIFHLLQNSSWAYFGDKVALESPGPWFYYSVDNATLINDQALSVAFPDCFDNSTSDLDLTCLRSKNVSELLSASISTYSMPVVRFGGNFTTELTAEPLSLINCGFQKPNVSVIMGLTAAEGVLSSYLAFPDLNVTFEEYSQTVSAYSFATSDGGAFIGGIYQSFVDNTTDPTTPNYFPALSAFFGDFLYECGTKAFAKKMSTIRPDNTWFYRFTHVPAQSPLSFLGAVHGSELPFVFGNDNSFGTQFVSEEVTFSDEIIQYWSNFHIRGSPNLVDAEGQPVPLEWPLLNYTAANASLILNLTYATSTVDFNDAFCTNVWEILLQYVNQFVPGTGDADICNAIMTGGSPSASSQSSPSITFVPPPTLPTVPTPTTTPSTPTAIPTIVTSTSAPPQPSTSRSSSSRASSSTRATLTMTHTPTTSSQSSSSSQPPTSSIPPTFTAPTLTVTISSSSSSDSTSTPSETSAPSTSATATASTSTLFTQFTIIPSLTISRITLPTLVTIVPTATAITRTRITFSPTIFSFTLAPVTSTTGASFTFSRVIPTLTPTIVVPTVATFSRIIPTLSPTIANPTGLTRFQP